MFMIFKDVIISVRSMLPLASDFLLIVHGL